MGRNKQAENQQASIANQQNEIARQNQQLATQNNQLRTQYQQPFIDFNTKIASGDRNAMMTASAVPLSNLNTQYRQSRANIYDTVQPGIGRDVALAQITRDQGDSTAGYLNQAYNQSMQNLYGAGTESGQMGLQQTGASLNGFQGASATNQNLINNATQRKAATMGAIGSLAGVAGGAALGGFGGGGARSRGGAASSGGGPSSGYAYNFGNQTFSPSNGPM